jgi:hypothetical protein
MMIELEKKCGKVHDHCDSSFPCPYCENKLPLRDVITGRFVSYKKVTNND